MTVSRPAFSPGHGSACPQGLLRLFLGLFRDRCFPKAGGGTSCIILGECPGWDQASLFDCPREAWLLSPLLNLSLSLSAPQPPHPRRTAWRPPGSARPPGSSSHLTGAVCRAGEAEGRAGRPGSPLEHSLLTSSPPQSPRAEGAHPEPAGPGSETTCSAFGGAGPGGEPQEGETSWPRGGPESPASSVLEAMNPLSRTPAAPQRGR